MKSDGNDMYFSMVGFLEFIAMVINCMAEMECKSQKRVADAGKYLGVRDFTAEELQGALNDSVKSSESAGMV